MAGLFAFPARGTRREFAHHRRHGAIDVPTCHTTSHIMPPKTTLQLQRGADGAALEVVPFFFSVLVASSALTPMTDTNWSTAAPCASVSDIVIRAAFVAAT